MKLISFDKVYSKVYSNVYINTKYRVSAGTSYDPAIEALLDQSSTEGFTPASGALLDAKNTFVIDLKNIGAWNLSDIIYLPATNGDVDFACYNLKNPAAFNLVRVNSPTFTDLEGFTGNGTSAYLDTQFNPATDGVNYALNSASFSLYIRNNLTSDAAFHGARDASGNFLAIRPRTTTNTSIYYINSISVRGASGITNSQGLTNINREGFNDINYYKNGVKIDDPISNNSSNIVNTNIVLCAYNNNGTIERHNTYQVSFAFLGGDLSGIASDFYNAIQTYMTSIGAAV